MLPLKGIKRPVVKPLPIKSHPTSLSTSSLSSKYDEKSANRLADKSSQSIALSEGSNRRKTIDVDYSIDESDDESSNNFLNKTNPIINRRNSLIDTRGFTPQPNLSDLLKPLTPEIVQKRRKRPSNVQITSLTASLSQKNPIDESSPVKKAKIASFSDQSLILINRSKRFEKKSPHRSSLSSLPHESLVGQMKALIEKEKQSRSIWWHSETSQLKNKFKETVKSKDTLTVKLSCINCKFHCTFAHGKVIETSMKSDYQANETVKLIFPSLLSDNMGLSNGTVIRLTAPWNMITINKQKNILNPFWVSVIKREDNVTDENLRTKETTLVDWTCPCRKGLGSIDHIKCSENQINKSQLITSMKT